MSYKDEIEKITIEKSVRKYYCDKCNGLFASANELEDGSYIEPKEMDIKLLICKDKYGSSDDYIWYTHSKYKYLCEKCKDEVAKEVINKLTKIGFKKDK